MNKQLNRADDAYREWDAAYVLGALSPSERHEYEGHLATCPACAAEVASIAGLGGLLASVPRERALALLDEEPPDAGDGETGGGGDDTVRQLAAATVKARRRARFRFGALLAGTAAAAAAVALALGSLVDGNPDAQRGRVVVLQQTIPTAIEAQAEFVDEPWGTRIEIECSYARTDPVYPVRGGQPPTWEYGMYVTDSNGETSLVATWMGGPGTTMWPTGSTGLAPEEIRKVDIRLMKSRTVVLEATL